jgi:hypothetical protein
LDIPLMFRLTWKCFPGPKKLKSDIAPCGRRAFGGQAQDQNRLDPLFCHFFQISIWIRLDALVPPHMMFVRVTF